MMFPTFSRGKKNINRFFVFVYVLYFRKHTQAIECCEPFNVFIEESQYNNANSTSVDMTCGDPSCAVSYVEDLAQFVERSSDPIQGCSSGIQVWMIGFRMMPEKMRYFSHFVVEHSGGLGACCVH
jgi:hypothetical protein